MTPAFRVYWCVMNKWGGGDVKFPPNINKAEDTVTKIKRPSCFDLKQIAESGQCFRFKMLMSDRHGVKYSVVYPVCRKTHCFSYGDIRHFHRIYASN